MTKHGRINNVKRFRNPCIRYYNFFFFLTSVNLTVDCALIFYKRMVNSLFLNIFEFKNNVYSCSNNLFIKIRIIKTTRRKLHYFICAMNIKGTYNIFRSKDSMSYSNTIHYDLNVILVRVTICSGFIRLFSHISLSCIIRLFLTYCV